MTLLQQLYELQAVDRDLDHRGGRLSDIASRLGDDRALAELREQVSQLQEEEHRVAVAQRELEDAVDSYTEKITQAESKLYGGTVTSPRELSDLQADVTQLKRRRAEQEERLMAVLEEVEGLQAQLRELSSRLRDDEQEWRAQQEAMAQEQRTLQSEVKNLSGKRASMAQQVPPKDLGLYEQVRRGHGGEAVARVRQGRCEACRIALPTRELQRVRTATSAVRCSSCGRILLVE